MQAQMKSRLAKARKGGALGQGGAMITAPG
jgi:hypothetical protein